MLDVLLYQDHTVVFVKLALLKRMKSAKVCFYKFISAAWMPLLCTVAAGLMLKINTNIFFLQILTNAPKKRFVQHIHSVETQLVFTRANVFMDLNGMMVLVMVISNHLVELRLNQQGNRHNHFDGVSPHYQGRLIDSKLSTIPTFLGFMWQHVFEWGSTLNRDTAIGVSYMFTICVGLVLGSEYIQSPSDLCAIWVNIWDLNLPPNGF